MSKVQYQAARKQYAALGVDTEKAIKALQKISISMHCWQGDDVGGFENAGALTAASRRPATIRARPARRRS